jgi:hypothetical protein
MWPKDENQTIFHARGIYKVDYFVVKSIHLVKYIQNIGIFVLVKE